MRPEGERERRPESPGGEPKEQDCSVRYRDGHATRCAGSGAPLLVSNGGKIKALEVGIPHTPGPLPAPEVSVKLPPALSIAGYASGGIPAFNGKI